MVKSCHDIERQLEAVKVIIRKNKIMKESDDEVSLGNSEETKDLGGRKIRAG
jgi:hypothetical protein